MDIITAALITQRGQVTTRLKRNADVGNKARFYILKCKAGAEMINPYNPDLLKAWRANMDIQSSRKCLWSSKICMPIYV
uniref:Uncharacterized protein n=1 Tax=Amphimedon queenslandica TaxID=400682 RepID=A0A1X7U405_AMPQE